MQAALPAAWKGASQSGIDFAGLPDELESAVHGIRGHRIKVNDGVQTAGFFQHSLYQLEIEFQRWRFDGEVAARRAIGHRVEQADIRL